MSPQTRELKACAMRKDFDAGKIVLDSIDLAVKPGEFLCIVGPSGVGKTTLLRCLAGLTPLSSGAVTLDGDILTGPSRDIGVVFQDYRGSLMPWMTTLENVAFPLQGKGVPRDQRLARARENLAAVGLAERSGSYPWELSGGMQQRVAIARALAYEARILLMDEPFGSLDAQTRFDLEDLVLGLHRRLGISIVVVTHDIDEAIYLADRIIVLSGQPARVVESIGVDLGRTRDQIGTRADPRFIALRGHVLGLIRR